MEEAKWQTELKRRIKERKQKRKLELKEKSKEIPKLAVEDERFKNVEPKKFKRTGKKIDSNPGKSGCLVKRKKFEGKPGSGNNILGKNLNLK